MHYAEVNIPMKLGAEVNIRCRSPQVGAEVIPCRSYSCRTSIAPPSSSRIVLVQVRLGSSHVVANSRFSDRFLTNQNRTKFNKWFEARITSTYSIMAIFSIYDLVNDKSDAP